MHTGSYYEMAHTNTLHYVRPTDTSSLSLMLTGPLYPEIRQESLDVVLEPLPETRKLEILAEALEALNQ